MQFNEEQQEAIDNFISGKSVFVSASAGTGKTTMLVHAYVKLLENGVKPSEIVAITFTKNAANEMLIKIRSLIRQHLYKSQNDNDKKNWFNIYNNFSKDANVSTIDSYASSIVRAYSYHLDLLPNITISSGTDYKCEQIMETVIENVLKHKEKYESIYNPMRLYISTNKRNFINEMIKFTNMIKPRASNFEIFENMVKSIFETKPDTKDIHIKINNNINDILDFEHSGKTVNALKGVVNIYKDKIIDIDSIKMLDKHEMKILLDELEKFIKNIKCGNVKIFKDIAAELRDTNLAKYYDTIFKIYYKDYINTLLSFIKDVFNLYEKQKISCNILTFDDLVEKSTILLENEKIQESINGKIKYVILDETQDTNNLQYDFINMLLFGTKNVNKDVLDEANKIAFIVGDRKQSIYRFRNANINSFLNYGDVFEKSKNSSSIYLKTNYRSEKYLIDFFNSFFENIFLGDHINYNEFDNLSAGSDDTSTDKKISFLMLNQNQSNGDKKINTEEAAMLEANAFARYIEKMLEKDHNIEYGSFALLLPTLKKLSYYIDAFTKYKIPFYIYSGRGFFERTEINNIIYFLRYLVLKEYSLISFIVNKDFFDISENDLYIINKILVENDYSLKDIFIDINTDILYLFDKFSEIKNKLSHIRNTIVELSYYSSFENASTIINLIISKTNYNAYLMTKADGDFAYSNIEKFIEMARLYERQNGQNIYDFLDNIDNLIQDDDRYSSIPLLKVNAISIMSVHASKGLEFDNVLFGGLGNKRTSSFNKSSFTFIDDSPHLPIYTDDYNIVGISEIDKETNNSREDSQRRRLLYVALTRAKNSLVVSGENTDKTSYRQFFDYYYPDLSKENIFDDETYDQKIPCSEYIDDLINITTFNNNIAHQYIDIYLYGYGILNRSTPYNVINNNTKIDIKYIEKSRHSAKMIIESASQTNRTNEPNLYNIKECLERLIDEYDDDRVSNDGETEEVSIMSVGTIVHSLLEIFDHKEYKVDNDIYIKKIMGKALFEIRDYKNKYNALEKIKKSIHNYINSIHIQNILTGKETIVMREHSFEKRIKKENGDIQIIRSKIDLLTKDLDNTYHIIDYKLSSFSDDIKEKYKNQMEIYRNAIIDMFSLKKEEAQSHIILLLDGSIINM